MNQAFKEDTEAPESKVDIDINTNVISENHVESIIETIKEAQYFDASSMAPLAPAALVSVSQDVLAGP